MLKQSGVVANTIYQVLAKAVTALGAFGVTYLLTRYLGLQGYGNYTIVITYITLFFVMGDFGLNSIFLREYGSSSGKFFSNLANLIGVRSLLSSFFIVIALLVLPFLPFRTSELSLVQRGVVIGLPLLLFQGFYLSLRAIAQYQQVYVKTLVAAVVYALVNVGLVWLIIVLGGGLLWLVVIAVLAQAMFAIALWITLGQSWSWQFDRKVMKSLMWLGLPIGLSLVLNVLLTNADKFLLSFMTNPEQVGLYGLGSKVFEVMLVVPTFFVSALYPVMLIAKRKGGDLYRQRLSWGFELAFMLALPATVIGFFFAPQIVNILGGASFHASGIVLQVLVLATVLFYLSAVIRVGVILEAKERYLPYIYGLGFAFDVILNLLLIPRYGLLAAAAVNGASEGLIVLLLLWLVRGRQLISFDKKRLLGILVASLLFAGVCWWGREVFLLWPVAMGGLIYLGLLWKLRILDQQVFRV